MSVWRKNFVSVFCVLQFSYYIFSEVCGIEIKLLSTSISQTLCVDDSGNESNSLVKEIMVMRSEKHYYKRRFSIERETVCSFRRAKSSFSHYSLVSSFKWNAFSVFLAARRPSTLKRNKEHSKWWLDSCCSWAYFRLIFDKQDIA